VSGSGDRPLTGLKVVDCASIFAGPIAATIMADFGADVIKVEHPQRGDTLRSWGWQKDGVSLWWAFAGRNKRSVTIKLSDPEGQELLLRLLEDADVFVENFRPGTLERWNLSAERLLERNPRLVIVRTSGFGQTGPYRERPGFGTLGEAISGFAHTNGWPDRPPALPTFALGDAVAGLTGCFAAMFCLWWRDHGGEGRGQVVDLTVFEPLFWILGPMASVYDQLGIVIERTGNRTAFTAPRNAYQTSDGDWLALSASAQSIAERVMSIVGRPDLAEQPWFADATGRLAHHDELDEAIQGWIGARTTDEVMAAFERGEGAIAPVYSIKEILEDPHFQAREAITAVEHRTLGPLLMQNMIVKLSETPGRIEFPGVELGEHNAEILGGELGLSAERLEALAAQGTIAGIDGPVPVRADAPAAAGGAPVDDGDAATRSFYADRRIGARGGWGRRPAVLVVDMSKAFCDPAYRVGAEAGETVDAIARLLGSARERDLPVVYTVMAFAPETAVEELGTWGEKIPALRDLVTSDANAVTMPDAIRPADGELVINKSRSSAFFRTELADELARRGVDTVILAGCSTSGCIRASALDAVSHDFKVIVPEECVADRAEGPHRANLFDIDAKYADVVTLDEVLAHLDGQGSAKEEERA
jgi:crotonobetainyl-CoA:carnitine CoA-transferase CaiB-like acyl-CoA transferase/nicotinamidase-related amidase